MSSSRRPDKATSQTYPHATGVDEEGELNKQIALVMDQAMSALQFPVAL